MTFSPNEQFTKLLEFLRTVGPSSPRSQTPSHMAFIKAFPPVTDSFFNSLPFFDYGD
jgi:hypothetical protein